MKKRKLLKTALISVPAFFSQKPLFAKDEKQSNRKTVVIIGAGIAGLAAAKKLQQKGFKVTVLESQNKVGGRLRTDRTLGIAFDEGASWIHGINGNPLSTLANQAGMQTAHTDDNSRLSYDMGGILRSTSTYNDAEEELYDILEKLADKGLKNKSFESVFNAHHADKVDDRLWQFLLSTYVTFDTGDLNKLSSFLYNEGEEFGGIEKIAVNGFDTIPRYLANGIDVQLNQRVTHIDYRDTKAKVTHNNSVTLADYVIVTVPLGVLKANVIEFYPALPQQKQNAIDKVGMNCVNKFLLTWDTRFWDDVQYISYTAKTKDAFNYFVNVNKYHPDTGKSTYALMTFAYAQAAREIETRSDEDVINQIMGHLKDIYGNDIPYPTNLLRTKWQKNPNSYGSYSYTSLTTKMHYFNDLAKAINSRVFFAGEHTEVDYFSTAHGAYLSGIREADRIISL